MADPYTSPTLSGYNANPPSDTGRAGGTTNIVSWANHTSKIGNPLRDYANAINTNIALAFAKIVGGAGVREIDISSGNQAIIMSDQGKLVMVTTGGANNVVLPDPASMGTPFVLAVGNATSTAATVSTAGGTINGLSALTLRQHESVVVFSDGTDWWLATSVPNLSILPRNYIDGLRLENAGQGSPVLGDANNDLVISPGQCADDGNGATLMLLSDLIKELDSNWVVGSQNGGLDNGSKASDTWYAVFLIKRSDTGVVDALFSTSATSPVMPSSYDLKRRIGWIRTDSSGNIVAFVQDGDRVLLSALVRDFNGSSTGTAALQALTVPPSARPIFYARGKTTGSAKYILITSPDQADIAATQSVHNVGANAANEGESGSMFDGSLRVNSSSQIRHRANTSAGLDLFTMGWIDARGKDT